MKPETESWMSFWQRVVSAPAVRIRSIPIAPARVRDSGEQNARFEVGKHYFAVMINELFLAKSREWWTLYDPMAVVTTEWRFRSHGWHIYDFLSGEHSEKLNIELTTPDHDRVDRYLVDVMQ